MTTLRNKHVLIQFMLPVKIKSVYVAKGTQRQIGFFLAKFLDSDVTFTYLYHIYQANNIKNEGSRGVC